MSGNGFHKMKTVFKRGAAHLAHPCEDEAHAEGEDRDGHPDEAVLPRSKCFGFFPPAMFEMSVTFAMFEMFATFAMFEKVDLFDVWHVWAK